MTMHNAKKTSGTAVGTRQSNDKNSSPRDSLSPRKLPRQERAAVTVAAILEAAAHILETGGFDAYTTNAIAARAGVSIGSLYQYFPNKTALTQALIAREDKALLRDLIDLVERTEASTLLHELIRVAATHQLRRPVLARLLDMEEGRLPPGNEAPHLDDALKLIFRHCLGEAVIALEPHVSQDIFSIIRGMVDYAGEKGESDADALAERVERAVFGYINTFHLDPNHRN